MTSLQLPIMTLESSRYPSPKRKRDEAHEHEHTQPKLITSGFRRNFDSLIGDRADTQSPSTRIAGKLQKLGLQSPAEVSNLSRVARYEDGDLTHIGLPSSRCPSHDLALAKHEQPAVKNDQSIRPPQSDSFSFEMASTTPSLQTSGVARSKSPPPADIVSDHFWHRSEITGHSPDDPDEDNYGVNGVGYQKTPAVAYAISQRRKQQIAEYRSRETREARQRRGERRLRARSSKSPTPSSGPVDSLNSDRKVTRFVHFSDR